jgi:hypothetical protein
MSLITNFKCIKCSLDKPYSERRKSGNTCKECHNKESRDRYKNKQEMFLKQIEEGVLKVLKCSKCKEEKDISNFCKNFRNCKECSSKDCKNYRINNIDNIKAKQEEKNNQDIILCPGCKIEKQREEYSNNVNYCKDCVSKRNKDKYKNNSENIKEKERLKRQYRKENKIKPDITHKKCSKCNTLKEIDNFSFSFSNGYQYNCNECRKKEAQEYRDANKEKIKILQRERYKVKPRTVNHIISKLRRNVAKYLYIEKDDSKTKEAKELLGIDIHLFQDWIKYNCDLDNLNYNEKNIWHIDHIIPCKQFNITEENIDDSKACFHWTNMMPLIARVNISKQDKIIIEQINIAKERLINFIKTKRLKEEKHMVYWNSYFNDIIEKIPTKNKINFLNTGSQ